MLTLVLGDFMSGSVLRVTPDLPLREVAEQMSETRVSCAVVCAADGKALGVVSERDLTRAYARDMQSCQATSASSAMSQGVLTMAWNDPCERAMQVMKERDASRLVVVDESNRVCGIVTQGDMLRALAGEAELQKSRLEECVAERTQELRELNERLESLARIDPLMGIGNRRAMDCELARMEQRALRYGRPYAVALVDLDYFRKFNECYGHGAGDTVLKQLAPTITSTIRAADTLFRYGGEELLLVFPEISQLGATVAAQHVRDSIVALEVPHEHSPFGYVTASIGVAHEDLDEPDWRKTLSRAGAALDSAKDRGRNRVACATRRADDATQAA